MIQKSFPKLIAPVSKVDLNFHLLPGVHSDAAHALVFEPRTHLARTGMAALKTKLRLLEINNFELRYFGLDADFY